MAYWTNRRRLLNSPIALSFGGGGGGMGATGPTFEDPYGEGRSEPQFEPIDVGPIPTGDGGGGDYGSGVYDPLMEGWEQPGEFGYPPPPGGSPISFGPNAFGGGGSNEPESSPYSPRQGGWDRYNYGGLSFGQGLGISALGGLFSALGGVLAADEAGRQMRRLKQTPANQPGDLARTARTSSQERRFAPPAQAPGQSQPMLGSPDARRNQMTTQLQQKMQRLLLQSGSPQLKASRFGVGGF